MSGRLAACAAFLGALGAAGPLARAEPERIALVDADAILERAVVETLAPWGVGVIVIRPLAPGDSMPTSADRARDLAHQYRVRAVSWISSSEEGYALWIFDDDGDRVVARRLAAPPPFDEPAAAAVALSIKTLLRHTEVAPREQRYSGQVAQNGASRRLELEAAAGFELRDTGTWRAESRLGLGLIWWPSLFGGHLGATLAGQTGVGIEVNEPAFVGHYAEHHIAIGARTRIGFAERFALVPILTGGVRVSSLSGLEPGSDDTVHVRRYNPSLDAALQAELRVSLLRIGLRLGASYLATRQRYLVRGEPVLELPSLSLEALLAIELPLH